MSAVLVCVTTDRERACITEELVAKGVCIGCTHTGCIDNGDGVGSGESRTNKGCTIHSGDIDGGSGDVCEVLVCVTTDREAMPASPRSLSPKVSASAALTLAASTTVMVSAVVSRTNKGCTIHSGDIDGGSGDVCEVLVCVTTDRERACITEELVAKGVCIGCTHTGCIDNGDGVSSGETQEPTSAPSTVVTLTSSSATRLVRFWLR